MRADNLTGSRFEEILIHLETQLLAELPKARAETSHAGDKGAKVEAATRDLLSKRLPSHLSVGCGKVYDAFGGESGQTDLVIANQDQPFTYPRHVPGEYLLEGVSAVGEIKSKLTLSEVKKSIALATKYKSLRPIRRSTDKPSNVSQYMDETDEMPPFFLLAFESSVSITKLTELLSAVPDVPPPPDKSFPDDHPQPPIDAVCILGKGVLWNLRCGDGGIKFAVSSGPDKGRLITGWFGFETAAPLAWTLSWLHLAMPRITRSYPVLGPYIVPGNRVVTFSPSDSGAATLEESIIKGTARQAKS
ncbi:hypothetical protein MSTE_01804 [Mycobacteroides stephanolepidis]|uniref:DUF6602 domain-containing protein n=1 Tax=[Mycobacterium] stephanolepidis TaxID=1520670 RepID=A0A1Z4EVZ5_9MYCO|nr:hypothetical protein MSTE_01804 [[Mycobacterium] stephanolepidis]